jgi:hypothetical protein
VIYQHGTQTVLKLYEKSFRQHEVVGEFEKTRLVAEHTTIPIAKPIEIITKNEQYGIVFERVTGSAVMDLMMQHMWRIPQYVRKLAAIHHVVHGSSVPLLSQEEMFLRFSTYHRLDDTERNSTKQALHLRTSDPKPAMGISSRNVLLTENGFFVLDWMDAFSGNPLLDLALTAVNAATSTTPSHIPKVFSFLYATVAKIVRLDRWVLHEYGVSEKQPEVHDSLLVAAAIHIARCKEKSWERQRKYFAKILTTN